MNVWIFRGVALAVTLSTAQALACPVAGNDPLPPRRPVQTTQNVSFQASELLERAQQLEAAAAERSRDAAALERDADTLTNRARLIRSQAALVNVAADRSSLFSLANELSARAAAERSEAADDRGRAADFRAEARLDRDRASQLVRVGNGGGWRSRPAPSSTTKAETSI